MSSRERLRELMGEHFGLRASALPDARLDDALARLAALDPSAPVDALVARLPQLGLEAPAWQRVVGALVVGETNFFRQRAWFAQLERHVLMPLIEANGATKRLRIWSAGCATGEEPYGIAIRLRALLDDVDAWDIRLTGTDVSCELLAAADRARYRSWSLREVDAAERERWFTATDDRRFTPAPDVRAMVTFAPRNLAAALPAPAVFAPGGVDLVICRNVLMYLDAAAQTRVAQRLSSYVAPGGWLVTAPLEANADWFPGLTLVNVPSAIFFHRTGGPA